MKRRQLVRKTPLKGTATLSRASKLAGAPSLSLRAAPMRRTPMKWKRRRPKPGDDPRYKAFIKTQPCVVGGWKCGHVDPHHLINGKGDARKGMGQTAPDKYLIPMCREHHDNFHDCTGPFVGWDATQRLTFQEQEIERIRSIWDDLNDLGVLQEPERPNI